MNLFTKQKHTDIENQFMVNKEEQEEGYIKKIMD